MYLYTPPTWRFVHTLEKALRYGLTTSTIVYRQSGEWFNQQVAGIDQPVIADVDVDPSGLLLFIDRPTPVPDSLVTELLAIEPADPSWTPGTAVPI